MVFATWLLGASMIVALAAPSYAQRLVSPSAPVDCYERVSADTAVTRSDALWLCRGATSVGPARCFERATDRTEMFDAEAVRLCTMATSEEPARCVERITEATTLVEPSVIGYCAAQPWPIAPPPGGSAACIEAARGRTLLDAQTAVALCQGATGDDPVTCFAAGKLRTTLSNRELVRLCARVVPYFGWQFWALTESGASPAPPARAGASP